MRQGIALLAGILVLQLAGCGGTKYIEQTNTAQTAFEAEDYKTSLITSEQIITGLEQKNKPVDGQVYAMAGNSAYALEQYDKSLGYLVKAQQQDYAGELMYFNLASLYRRIDNLSKEIAVLETYNKLYPEGKEINRVRSRLFQTCLESTNFDLADLLWSQLDETSKQDLANLDVYLAINTEQENDKNCDWAAAQILEQDENHEQALKWLAEKYFWKAENRYQAEMEAYNNNKTHKQYNILVKAFKTVTADFKTSLKYYTKLYKLYPEPEYAMFLGNIYARLDDEKMAEYYRDLAGN
jgi:tetratricopeptide (TPR) repeat protein